MNSSWSRIFTKNKKTVEYVDLELDSISKELSTDVNINIKNIKQALGNSSDLTLREFKLGKPFSKKVATLYINGLADKQIMGSFIIERLMDDINIAENEKIPPSEQIGIYIKEHLLAITHVVEVKDWKKLFLLLLSGQTIILIDECNQAIACAAQGGELRSISEPLSEPSVRGPRDSFTESLITNTSLIRSRIKTPDLWLETREIGDITQTEIGIMYINGIVNNKLLQEVRERLDKIKVDDVFGSSTIEEWISDKMATPWPTMFVTERPDVVAGNLLEGRVVIFVNGTPNPLILPATWIQFFQTAEDYYLRWSIVGFLRLIRILSFMITLLGPSLFIAFLSFHQELIPTPLLINLAAQRQNVPFPVIIEALLMEFTFEVLREAGVRMPRPVGQAVSIVGALVLGDAAVSAGIVSSAMVIVVAATAIASFTIPHYAMTDATRLLRFSFMILAATYGLFGIGIGVIVLVAHTCSLRSFGIPYLAPFSPIIIADLKDTIIRLPLPFMTKRPRLINKGNANRVEGTADLGPTERKEKKANNKPKSDTNET
ncbi:spore germination protein [Niallia sp. NCCP-28]|uniref:spore germination protein n=1 Tax=Niallia sp. NCCP-28 TaxID=2934712 RepID=UPI00207E22A0|nr:spore germination protein [Niallia sp. NCCP-28]GKU83516.1 spore germination protein KA [Niallia sp. NCCP-28]